MPKSNANLALKGLDEMFSTEESRQEQKREQASEFKVLICTVSKERADSCQLQVYRFRSILPFAQPFNKVLNVAAVECFKCYQAFL